MRWRGRKQSDNVRDLRGRGPGRLGGGGPVRRVSLGGGCLGIVLVLLFILMGGDPAMLMQQGAPGGGADVGIPDQNPAGQPPLGQGQPESDDPLAAFVRVVLQDTEDVWAALFRQQVGRDYDAPTLNLFSGRIRSACGFASAAVGPFYCPSDRSVYLDLSFFQQMKSQIGAPGDFAMAYVIAHEVAHHVQNEVGQMQQVHRAQRGRSEVESNRLSVRLELQADYLAGVWAHHAQRMKQILEPGDIEEALRAATAIGDDKLQSSAQGYVVPDSFTHGTSAQRLRWFRQGLQSGDMQGMQQLFEIPYDSL